MRKNRPKLHSRTKNGGVKSRTVAHSVHNSYPADECKAAGVPSRERAGTKFAHGHLDDIHLEPLNMLPDQVDHPESAPDVSANDDPMLRRVKEVSKRIAERVRKLMDDTKDKCALPADPTDETPPIA
jgi:hypothetical protein